MYSKIAFPHMLDNEDVILLHLTVNVGTCFDTVTTATCRGYKLTLDFAQDKERPLFPSPMRVLGTVYQSTFSSYP